MVRSEIPDSAFYPVFFEKAPLHCLVVTRILCTVNMDSNIREKTLFETRLTSGIRGIRIKLVS